MGLINLHRAYQAIATRTHHSRTQSVKHSPCCLIPVEPQNSLKSQSAYSLLLADNMPDSQKPQTQRNTRILKDSSCCNRDPISTILALILSVLPYPIFSMITVWTDKSFWPSHLTKIFSARLFTIKKFLELKHSLRVILHSPRILHLGAVVVKRIAL